MGDTRVQHVLTAHAGPGMTIARDARREGGWCGGTEDGAHRPGSWSGASPKRVHWMHSIAQRGGSGYERGGNKKGWRKGWKRKHLCGTPAASCQRRTGSLAALRPACLRHSNDALLVGVPFNQSATSPRKLPTREAAW